jgi:hypothetical protein
VENEPVVRFTLDGHGFELQRGQVEKAMAGVPAEPLRSHAVQVGETWYPVKQVFERATGADRSDFISTTARRQLKKLGFPVRRD